jgi:hypothetical protein
MVYFDFLSLVDSITVPELLFFDLITVTSRLFVIDSLSVA